MCGTTMYIYEGGVRGSSGRHARSAPMLWLKAQILIDTEKFMFVQFQLASASDIEKLSRMHPSRLML